MIVIWFASVFIPGILGYGYPFMPYGMPYGIPYGMGQNPYPPFPMNPYPMNPMASMSPMSPMNPMATPYGAPQGAGMNPMPFYPTYVQNYGMIPTEIIDEPDSKELVDAKTQVLIPNANSNLQTQNVTKFVNGPVWAPGTMFANSNGPYPYVPRPPFKIAAINSTNDVKSSFTGPLMTSSISKSQPSQTVITRVMDPKTGDAKVDIKTDAQKLDDSKNNTNIRTHRFLHPKGPRLEDEKIELKNGTLVTRGSLMKSRTTPVVTKTSG